MPLKLNVGLSRKVGLPGYSSLGASCHVEVELDAAALREDPDAFQHHVRTAFNACRQSVSEELSRNQPADNRQSRTYSNGNGSRNGSNGSPGTTSSHGRTGNGHGNGNNGTGRNGHSVAAPASVAQRRAIESICRRLELDPHEIATDHHFNFDALTVRHASMLIDQLRRLEHAGSTRQSARSVESE